ncbi:MAG TPA: hypothetical protein DCS93_27230 [Microscillaceae bacterium]|nr:hypothetical protein [Microscillaceae bacterium]
MKKIFQLITLLFAVFMFVLAYLFWTDFTKALEVSNHALNNMGKVLAGRFMVSAMLAIFAAWYFDAKVLAFVFLMFAFMALADGFTYYAQNLPHFPHTITGIFCLIVAALAFAYRKKLSFTTTKRS